MKSDDTKQANQMDKSLIHTTSPIHEKSQKSEDTLLEEHMGQR